MVFRNSSSPDSILFLAEEVFMAMKYFRQIIRPVSKMQTDALRARAYVCYLRIQII